MNVGEVWTFRGGHDLLVEELPCPPHKTTVTVLAHGNLRRWVDPEDAQRRALSKDLRLRHASMTAQKLECRDPECWCRKYLEGTLEKLREVTFDTRMLQQVPPETQWCACGHTIEAHMRKNDPAKRLGFCRGDHRECECTQFKERA